MKLQIVVLIGIIIILNGCNSNKLSVDDKRALSTQTIDTVGDIPRESSSDVEALRLQLEQQKVMLNDMSEQQRLLKEQIKRQQLQMTVIPLHTANAGHGKEGTASIAYIAALTDKRDFADLQSLALKEISLIPNRPISFSIPVSEDTKYIAVKIDLRYTKKRSQFLIPMQSISFEEPLSLIVGACDSKIESGIKPEDTPDYSNKLQYYLLPLVECY